MEGLLRYRDDPDVLHDQITRLDMRALIERVWDKFRCRVLDKEEVERRALLCSTVAHFSERLSLNVTDGMSLDITRVSTEPEHLYSASGHSIWFAPSGFSYDLRRFRRVGDRLVDPQLIHIDQHSPLLVDGDSSVVDVCPLEASEHLVFSLNIPVPLSDIHVYGLKTLTRIAWFPADAQVPRFLVVLEALVKIQDPNLERVAGELIYHHHPAVRWQAFLVLMQFSPEKLEEYCELMSSLEDSGLQAMVANYLAERSA